MIDGLNQLKTIKGRFCQVAEQFFSLVSRIEQISSRLMAVGVFGSVGNVVVDSYEDGCLHAGGTQGEVTGYK
jgi:hypothetical protein